MINNYCVIKDTDMQELVNSVAAQCRAGWQPCGGVAMLREPGGTGKPAVLHYAQAMVLVGAPAPNGKKLEFELPEKRIVLP